MPDTRTERKGFQFLLSIKLKNKKTANNGIYIIRERLCESTKRAPLEVKRKTAP
jgi:hypothetical protein